MCRRRSANAGPRFRECRGGFHAAIPKLERGDIGIAQGTAPGIEIETEGKP